MRSVLTRIGRRSTQRIGFFFRMIGVNMKVSRYGVSLFAFALLAAPAGAWAAKPAAGGGQGPSSGAATSGGSAATTIPSASASTTASASTGSPTTASFESQMLAYGAVEKIAQNVADNVCSRLPTPPAGPHTLVIYDQSTFATVLAYSSFIQNAKLIEGAYSTLTPAPTKAIGVDAVTGAAAVTPTVSDSTSKQSTNSVSLSMDPISDVTQLISALATSSNSETYGSVTIPDSVVALAVTGALPISAGSYPSCNGLKIVYPPMFGQGSAGNQAAIDVQTVIAEVQDARSAAHAFVDKELTTAKGQTSTQYPGLAQATALSDIDTLYDGFINSLTQVNATTGQVGIQSVVQGHALADLLSGEPAIAAQPAVLAVPGQKAVAAIKRNGRVIQAAKPEILEIKAKDAVDAVPAVPPAYVLLATVLSAGGSTHDHKTFWTNLSSGDQITYSGGAIIGVSLWQASQSPLYAKVLRVRFPFQKSAASDDLTAPSDNLDAAPPAAKPLPPAAGH